MSKSAKEWRLKAAREWTEKAKKTGQGQHVISKIEADEQKDIDSVLNSMSAKQLRILTGFISMGYNMGASDTREHMKSLTQQSEQYEKEKQSERTR